MFYGTHSAAMLMSAFGEKPVEVSCFGYKDKIGDGIYGEGVNPWDNPFSNETAVIRFESGALGRMNEFRRIGTTRPSSYITGIYGTKGAYEYSGNQHIFSKGHVFGQQPQSTDVSDEVNTYTFVEEKDNLKNGEGRLEYKYHTGWSAVWWNGPNGFNTERQTHLPTKGPHGMISNNIGNIMDRSFNEYYYSTPYAIDADCKVKGMTVDADIPQKTDVICDVRVNSGEWQKPEGVALKAGDTLEYRLNLYAYNCLRTPRVTKVTVDFE
jgi:hypothetical protein